MTTTTQPTFLSAFADALAERIDLAGVEVWTSDIGPSRIGREAIVFTDIEGSEEWYGLGNLARNETYTVSGVVWVVAPGASETIVRQARDRAYEIYAEVEQQLRDTPNLGGIRNTAQVASTSLDQFVAEKGQAALLSFGIRVQAYLEVTS